uniref:Myosin_tail_1 domain-containing protein n=1 Tax=Anisakis simplex TaxID=6269 RepID=A0A0M3JB60_ANISI
LGEKQHTVDRQLTEIDDQKHAYESEINRLKSELAALEAKYQNELEDERDQHQHDADVLKATEEELRTKITLLETKLEAANDREKNLHNEIAEWEDKYDSVNKELQKVRDELDVVRSDSEKINYSNPDRPQRLKSETIVQKEPIKFKKLSDPCGMKHELIAS